MSRPTKPVDPQARLGVYKRLADVPDRRRLSSFASMYGGRDVWQEFVEKSEAKVGTSERFVENIERVERSWKQHMDGCGHHHALATPTDVDMWCADLLDGRAIATVRDNYWLRVERFYRWLLWHTGHPHRYSPALMAAATGEAAPLIWESKIDRHRQDRERYHD